MTRIVVRKRYQVPFFSPWKRYLVPFSAGVVALALGGCSTSGRGLSPEKFMQPAPAPLAAWKTGNSTLAGKPALQFENLDTGDRITSAILDTMDAFPATEFRRTFDETLQKECTNSTSQLIDETPLRGLPRQIWMTECDKDGAWLSQLHLYVTGKDSGFYSMYEWTERPDAAAVKKVTKYMKEVDVCDERPSRKMPCPAPTRGDRRAP